MTDAMRTTYGNPSSMHRMGVEAEKLVMNARTQIAKTLRANPGEIFFTSGGTESDNWALLGGANTLRRRGNHLITTRIEHPAILNTMAALEKQGFEVTYLPTDASGAVSPERVREALRDDTILVSVMSVNNEIGSIQPVAEIGALVHAHNPETLFHVDAVQGYTKVELIPKRMNIDLMSVSGHKIHGPKGVGYLYLSDKVRLTPILHGGGQQNNLRSGTENVPGIVGLGIASANGCRDMAADTEKLAVLKKNFADALLAEEDVFVNGPSPETGAPHILNVSFQGIRSEVMLHSLEDKGIYVSAGSACSSHKREMSATHKAIGLDKNRAESAIRFSFSSLTNQEELDYTMEVIHTLLPALRRYSRK